MTSSMLRKKEVTISGIMKYASHIDFITIKEDFYFWKPWMLVDPKEINIIMDTE